MSSRTCLTILALSLTTGCLQPPARSTPQVLSVAAGGSAIQGFDAEYDDEGRITSMIRGTGEEHYFEWEDGRVVGWLDRFEILTTVSYDGDYPTRVVWGHEQPFGPPREDEQEANYTWENGLLVRAEYEFRSVGREEFRTAIFSYDEAGRITEAFYEGEETNLFDGTTFVSRDETILYDFDEEGRLRGVDGTTVNADGEVGEDLFYDDEVFLYDAEGRLASVGTTEYSRVMNYDDEGRLATMTSNDEVTLEVTYGEDAPENDLQVAERRFFLAEYFDMHGQPFTAMSPKSIFFVQGMKFRGSF